MRKPALHPLRARRPTSSAHKQGGIAALEFAFVALFIMVPLFLGIFLLWEVLQTQQVVTRATGDGARQVFRLMQSARERKPDGTVPTDADMRNSAAQQVQKSITSTLKQYLSAPEDINQRVSVTLTPTGSGQLTLDVSYARPAILGNGGGWNFIEPSSLKARSVIHWP